MGYVQIKRNFLEKLEGPRKVGKYLLKAKQNHLSCFKATSIDELRDGNSTTFRLQIDDSVSFNDPKLKFLKDKQKARLVKSKYYKDHYYSTSYDIVCSSSTKGTQLKIKRAYTGPSLAHEDIYFSDIASYVLLLHCSCRRFRLNSLKFHSILLGDVTEGETVKLGYEVRKNMLKENFNYPKYLTTIHPKVKDYKNNVFSEENAFGYLRKQFENSVTFKFSEYSDINNKRKLLSSGWGKSIKWLCKTLGINLKNAKVSFTYYGITPDRLRSESLCINKIKIAFTLHS